MGEGGRRLRWPALLREVLLGKSIVLLLGGLLIGWIALALLSVFTVPLSAFNLKGVLFFALIGLVAPPVVRYLTYIGVERMGAARSDTVRALTPLFAILFATLFLGEKAGAYVLWGTLLIIFGVWLLSRE